MRMNRAKFFNFYKRQISNLFNKKLCKLNNKRPIVTFTFDDFPKTAYTVGGEILNRYNFKATYYASLKFMGLELPYAKAFSAEDLDLLLKNGHELGCHTYDHFESWETPGGDFNESIIRNSNRLQEIVPNARFASFSYPKTSPSSENKGIAGKYFHSSRGGGQTNNARQVDLNLLRSYFLDKRNNQNLSEIRNMINKNSMDNGWLIFSTHDISDTHSNFGCGIKFFENIVTYVASNNFEVLNVSKVVELYCGIG
jgi:peptidoglycan/xylan/chitin deacetylase (PgdA/CDA1 family)